MKIKLGKLSVLTVLVSAIGLMSAFAASASADSITCEISGSIKLSPGLTETPQVQNISITKHKGAALTACSGTETTVTGGNVNIHMKTEKAVTCAALKSTGEAVVETNAIFKWQPKGEGTENSTGTFSMPLTEESVALGGTIATGSFPFSEDTISGTVKQSYIGGETCGVSSGHKKAKKVNKGSFTGSITIS
jgi:hypothetical protein